MTYAFILIDDKLEKLWSAILPRYWTAGSRFRHVLFLVVLPAVPPIWVARSESVQNEVKNLQRLQKQASLIPSWTDRTDAVGLSSVFQSLWVRRRQQQDHVPDPNVFRQLLHLWSPVDVVPQPAWGRHAYPPPVVHLRHPIGPHSRLWWLLRCHGTLRSWNLEPTNALQNNAPERGSALHQGLRVRRVHVLHALLLRQDNYRASCCVHDCDLLFESIVRKNCVDRYSAAVVPVFVHNVLYL